MTMNVTNLIPWTRNRSTASSTDLQGEGHHPFLTLHREINRLFDDMWHGIDTPSFGFGRGAGWPRVDIVDADKAVTVKAELPGLEERDIEVLFSDGTLTIRGETKQETQDGDRQLRERYYGHFERRIALESKFDAEKISAAFKNGLLTVTLPKSPDAQTPSRRIPISS
jgi:HSP20 family protein